MKDGSIIGVHLARQGFRLHGATAEGNSLFRRKPSRKQFPAVMQTRPTCMVAMEACATAHRRARTPTDPGHDVRLIAPKFVRPCVRNRKNDMADAEAIAGAASRPTMRAVEVRSPAQQGLGTIFRLRDLRVGQRTQSVNALRGCKGCRELVPSPRWPWRLSHRRWRPSGRDVTSRPGWAWSLDGIRAEANRGPDAQASPDSETSVACSFWARRWWFPVPGSGHRR